MREYVRKGRDIVKMRQWYMRRREQGWSGNKIAAHLRVPRRTVYYWINKYTNCSKGEMVNHSSKAMMVIDDPYAQELRDHSIRPGP